MRKICDVSAALSDFLISVRKKTMLLEDFIISYSFIISGKLLAKGSILTLV